MRIVVPLIALTLIGALIAGVVRARRRRRVGIPELNQHPERLEQMLDESDDA
jgi:hypothetical protein